MGQTHNGRGNLARKHVEGDQLADGQFAVHHQRGADPYDCNRDQFADEGYAAACHHGNVVDAQTGGYVSGQLLFPFPVPTRLHRHGLDRVDAADGFHQKSLVFGAAIEFLVAGVRARSA